MPVIKKTSDDKPIRVETLTLDDGRRAERHITTDENGNEIVEIFAEEVRPLKLEKRIVREYKSIISKEVHEMIKDGEVAYQEVRSLEPEIPLQVRSRIGLVDHHKMVNGDYVRKEEIDKLISDGVVAGVTALMEKFEQVPEPVAAAAQPVFRAQEVIERKIEEDKKSDMWINIAMGVIIVAQIAFFVYLYVM